MNDASNEIRFDELTPLGFSVRTTERYWQWIVTVKHPVMRGKEALVRAALRDPEQIRRSRSDPEVYLFYRPDPPYHVAVVIKKQDETGFIVTAYRTEAIKEGELIWPR
jgi:hypothetical protein